jgi:hypothetical protein
MAKRWVRVVTGHNPSDLESTINAVIDAEAPHGAELVDIKLTATPGTGTSSHGGIGSSLGEFVALLIFQAVSMDY